MSDVVVLMSQLKQTPESIAGSFPVFYHNMVGLFDWDLNEPQAYLCLLRFWAPVIDAWLDESDVKGNAENQFVVDDLYKLYLAFADWGKLREGHDSIRHVFKRLNGLRTKQ